MIGIVITGHGPFATALAASLKMITGITENIIPVDFDASHSIKTLTDNLCKAYDELKACDGILVCSDLAGGSPFKAAVECKYERPEQKIEVLAGINLPMLIEGSVMMRFFKAPLEMAEALIPVGRDCIVRFELASHEDNTEEDGI